MRACESNTQSIGFKRGGSMTQPTVQRASPKILDNVLDMGSTIANILTICGIDNGKATKAVSAVTHAFLHFDEDQVGDYGLCKTRHMRKEDLLKSLRDNCCMSETEARLTVSVVKCAFRAFYHKQSIRRYDPAFYTEEDWTNAAERTINAYAKSGATKSDLELAATRIQEAYKGYLNRVSYKRGPVSSYGNASDALHRVNCYHCSTKQDTRNMACTQPNPINEQRLPQQVICTCCGCLKRSGVSPASYRDGKGRSILLVEDNSLYYNTQVMKQECDNLQQPTFGAQIQDTSCEGNFSRALFKLTRDMVNRIIKGGGTVDSPADKNIPLDSSDINAGPTIAMPKEMHESQKKADEDCDCHDKAKNRRRRTTILTSSEEIRGGGYGSTPPNSIDESYKRGKRRRSKLSDAEAMVHIRSSKGRARIDIVGPRLLDNEYDGPAEFICKRKIRTVNRYTQTGGSAGVSACSSSSTVVTDTHKRRSSASSKNRTSSFSGKARKPSFGEAIQHSYPTDGDDENETVVEIKQDSPNENGIEEIYVNQQQSFSLPGENMMENFGEELNAAAAEGGGTEQAGEPDFIEFKEEVVEVVEETPADDIGRESIKEDLENPENKEVIDETVTEHVE